MIGCGVYVSGCGVGVLLVWALSGCIVSAGIKLSRHYGLRRVASRAVLTDMGCIDGRGRPLRCFLFLLSD